MSKYLAMLVVLVIAFYTVLFGLENLKEKNVVGFIAISFLALVIIAIPFYMLFLLV